METEIIAKCILIELELGLAVAAHLFLLCQLLLKPSQTIWLYHFHVLGIKQGYKKHDPQWESRLKPPVNPNNTDRNFLHKLK